MTLSRDRSPPRIREAARHESDLLSDLAFRSKAHWGYSDEFMAACRDELTVDAARAENDDYRCFVATEGGFILGFYLLVPCAGRGAELEALFVEPAHIGKGVGRALIAHALRQARMLGADKLLIQGDPNATGFYLAAGARHMGERESVSIPGRFLPLFEIALPAE